MNLGLVPLRNWGVVAPYIYRSAQPIQAYEYKWLQDIANVQHVINLRAELNHDIKMLPAEMVTTIAVLDHQPPTLRQATDFIRLIRQNVFNTVSTLIHCEHGHGRTSTFSVLSKMALGWSLDGALIDEKERFHYEFRHPAQTDWLRHYEAELTRSLKSEAAG